MSVCPDVPVTIAPKYARFSRRFRGIVLDWMILMAILFGALMLASTVRNDNFARVLGTMVIAALLLYEPVLVSFTGSTLGHYFTNLRVVDERTGGNVSFLKACARAAIKGVLGLYSFVILMATRRNQAVHDILTKSTVQIRDPAKALPGQYVNERDGAADTSLPSWWRRVATICVYLALVHVAYIAVAMSLSAAGLMSKCLYRQTQPLFGGRVAFQRGGGRPDAAADCPDHRAWLEGQVVRRTQGALADPTARAPPAFFTSPSIHPALVVAGSLKQGASERMQYWKSYLLRAVLRGPDLAAAFRLRVAAFLAENDPAVSNN